MWGSNIKQRRPLVAGVKPGSHFECQTFRQSVNKGANFQQASLIQQPLFPDLGPLKTTTLSAHHSAEVKNAGDVILGPGPRRQTLSANGTPALAQVTLTECDR